MLLDAVFKHLELTERDYFGLHLADDSLDTPVSVMSYLQESLCVGGRGRCVLMLCVLVFYQLKYFFMWPLVNNSSIHAVVELSLSVSPSIFYSAGWIPTSPSGNS